MTPIGLIESLLNRNVAASGAARALCKRLDAKVLARILRTEQGANTLIALNLPGGANARVLVKEYQLDPITHQLLHADFYRVAMDKVIRVQVNVVAQGEPKGVKQQGGVLDIVHRQVEIECLPADIPNHIDIDVSEMMVGQSIRVKDVATNPKWKALSWVLDAPCGWPGPTVGSVKRPAVPPAISSSTAIFWA